MSNKRPSADFNASPETPPAAVVTAFFAAAEKGEADELRDMLELYPALCGWKEHNTKSTALIVAAKQGNAEAVHMLLDGNADIRAEDAGGMNALFHAAYNGHFEACVALVGAGADPAETGRHGISAIAAAKAGDFPSLSTRLEIAAAEREAILRDAWHDVGVLRDGTREPLQVMKQLSLKIRPR